MTDGAAARDALSVPIFVYGTLRSGDVGFVEAGLDGRVRSLGPAAICGTLYDLGDYPGFVPGGAGVVAGELLLPLDPDLLAHIDTYELYDPTNEKDSEYLRVMAALLRPDISAWIYTYNRCVSGAPVIPGGDWKQR